MLINMIRDEFEKDLNHAKQQLEALIKSDRWNAIELQSVITCAKETWGELREAEKQLTGGS